MVRHIFFDKHNERVESDGALVMKINDRIIINFKDNKYGEKLKEIYEKLCKK